MMVHTQQRIHDFLAPRLPHYLELLRQMVGINSFTANAAGVNQLGKFTEDLFVSLGFTAEHVQAADFMHGNHLVLTRPAARPGAPKIGLTSHLDTVYPPAEERANDFTWRVAGERLYGPGTVDIKGGTLMILMLLDALQHAAPALFEAVTWVVLLNAAEEVLAPDFGDLLRERLAGATLANLVFEGGKWNGRNGQLVVARKGMACYRIEVVGKAAHAGVAHDLGANAIVQLAEVVQRVDGFTDYDQALTFNVGTMAGGTVLNRVPHQASASVEMRTFSPGAFDAGMQKMLALNDYSSVRSLRDGYPCQVRVEVLGSWDPWARNPATDGLLALWQEVGRELGVELLPQERGGLSDGNWTWAQIPTLDGLGPAGDNAHCSERSADGSKDQEYALADSFVPKTVLNALAVSRLIETAAPVV